MNPRRIFWNLFFAIVNPFRRLYWRIVRPQTRGVKCLVEKDGKFLLVRITYRNKYWTIPGGGVGRKEDFKSAAFRELKEETGLTPSSLEYFGQYYQEVEGKRDTVQCFYTKVDASAVPVVDYVEIAEANWFSKEELPTHRSKSTNKILEMFDSYRKQ